MPPALISVRCAGKLSTRTTFTSMTSFCSAKTTSGSSTTLTLGQEHSLRRRPLVDWSDKPTLPSLAISSGDSSLATDSFSRTRPSFQEAKFSRGRRPSEHFQQVVKIYIEWQHQLMNFSVICDNAPIKQQSLAVIKLPVHAMKQVTLINKNSQPMFAVYK